MVPLIVQLKPLVPAPYGAWNAPPVSVLAANTTLPLSVRVTVTVTGFVPSAYIVQPPNISLGHTNVPLPAASRDVIACNCALVFIEIPPLQNRINSAQHQRQRRGQNSRVQKSGLLPIRSRYRAIGIRENPKRQAMRYACPSLVSGINGQGFSLPCGNRKALQEALFQPDRDSTVFWQPRTHRPAPLLLAIACTCALWQGTDGQALQEALCKPFRRRYAVGSPLRSNSIPNSCQLTLGEGRAIVTHTRSADVGAIGIVA